MPQVTQQDERGPLRVSRYSLGAPQTGPVMRLHRGNALQRVVNLILFAFMLRGARAINGQPR